MRRGPLVPTTLTIFRLLLTPVVASAILASRYRDALVYFFVAAVTDGLDGILARRFGWGSRLGASLDPVADKALLGAVYICLGLRGAVPWWLVVLIFGRDVMILGLAGLGLALTKIRDFPPSRWGKLSTVVQVATAVAAMCAEAGLWDGFRAVVRLLIWLAAGATAWSGFDYFRQACRRYRELVRGAIDAEARQG